MSQMILRPLSRNILRRPRVILQVSHESKKIKFKHTIRGEFIMNNITFNKSDFIVLASGATLLTAFIYTLAQGLV
ncbi:hypothetical protein DF16_orf00147 [Bacillus thuringiensis serovar kurstaki str. YBT-1520]|nr:hypothetical protein DF16_orf00147 [Bacillus thuringiensis serovar kurstaki str. YBT-1520]